MKMSDEKRRELRLESQRRYRERNAALIREKARKYREANREAQKERHRKWWEANKDEVNARARERRAEEKLEKQGKPIGRPIERVPKRKGEIWMQRHRDKGVEYEVKWVAKICKSCHKLTWQYEKNHGLCFDCFVKEYSRQFRRWIDWRLKAGKVVIGK